VLPRWVRSLDDYWSWFAEQLDYSGGRLEDEQGDLIWRMDKHPGHGALSHIHRPGDRPDPYPEVDITDVLSELVKQLE
jgi:hypothetical protein